MPVTGVLDTCVLCPMYLRDTLLRLARYKREPKTLDGLLGSLSR